MNYKLLIAENEPSERAALSSTLNRHLGDHLTIYEAGSGNEALELFGQETPQIAILNIDMPGMGGLEVARKIREANKNCSILFLSSFNNFSDAKEAVALQALDYLVKPYDEQKLLASVEEAMQIASRLENAGWNLSQLRHPPAGSDPETARLTMVREDIRSFIDSHYMEELSMKNVANAMNYSDAYFCKLFKQCFQVNFSTYLNEYRVEKAKAMMENSRISIKDISLACGYTDSNYFTRVFKRITGQTPTEYRFIFLENNLYN